MSRARRLLHACQITLLAASVCMAGVVSEQSDWSPPGLLVLLFVLAASSELFPLKAKTGAISASFLALVLAMTLLGPSPAAAIGVSVMLVNGARRRSSRWDLLTNVSTYAAFPLIGGVLFEVARGPDFALTDGASYIVLAFVLFMAVNALNFMLIAVDLSIVDGMPIPQSLRAIYLPLLPIEFAIGLLTAGVALAYHYFGLGAVGLLGIICLVFQYLFGTALNSIERKEQLEGRTRQLASLQVGLLSTVLQTLSLRDKMTARHSAAVARYAREMARSIGLSEHEQEIVHTAGLLHDIGKFIFPDTILFAAQKLTDEEFAIIRKHPEQGAKLVRRIDGYGPIADIIHAHHERIDGRGYPNGLSGDEIPLAARMIAVADTYDVMTARDSYRKPVSSEEAIAELRRVSGSQLDGQLVEVFITLVEHKTIRFKHADDAEFERELNFEARVRDYASPRSAAA